MTTPVPHPGARPEALRFPFEQAQAAADAADRLATALDRAGSAHRSQAEQALSPTTPFRGASADLLRTALGEALGQADRLRHRLDASIEELGHTVQRARAAEQDRLRAQRTWDLRMAEHRAWRDADRGAPR